MKAIRKLLFAVGTGVLAIGLTAIPAGAANAATPHPASVVAPDRPASSRGVVFVQNDALSGNTVIAYDRTPGGGLAQVGSYPTGGQGGALSGSVVDHLASEGSLAYDSTSRLLFAVNAGSNTLTTFTVSGDRLVRRQVVPTGSFPVSVATRGNLVYVLNARDGGSISGYLQLGGVLLPIPAWHRDLHLNTSMPGLADEFTSTPGQIGFTPDGRRLVISTKNGGNSVETFAVSVFGPSRQPVVTSLPGTVPFGFAFDSRGHLVLTEAAPDAVASFTVDRSGRLTELGSVVTGQAATCWVVASGNDLYVSNAGSASISRYTAAGRGRLTAHGTTATDAGTVDAAVSADGRYLYVQTGAAGTVDAYQIRADGSLSPSGSVTVPGAAGAEGIVAL